MCISLFRSSPINIDWAGVLVATLVGLVTALIGWQIYSIIDFRKETQKSFEKMNEHSKERSYVHNSQMCLLNKAMMDFYYEQGKKIITKDPKTYMYYWHGIAAMQQACLIDDYITANMLVKAMIEVYDKSLTIRAYHKSLLLRMLHVTINKESLEAYDKLEDIIIKMDLELE